jgi:DNA polymerase-3 subunit epsilon
VIPLDQLAVVVLDCQTTGASPKHGHLLELAWSVGQAADPDWPPVRSHLVRLPEGARIPPRIAKLTGICDADLEAALPPAEVRKLLTDCAPPIAVAHFARFERSFLDDLPVEWLCTHEIACRLMPGLPRRGLRALSGYFGHVMEEEKRAAGHVRATRSVWAALVKELDGSAGIATLEELREWMGSVAPVRTGGRDYLVDRDTRLALPDRPGIYRMQARGGEVLYVGKATSLKSRVNSYFRKSGDGRTMTPELLTQTCAIDFTETPSPLEAALLECDEIKRLAPPYNTALRGRSLEIRFATRDLETESGEAGAEFPVGPLPHRDALACFPALRELLDDPDRDAGDPIWRDAIGIPAGASLDESHFRAGFELFVERRAVRPGTRALLGLGARLWRERAEEPEEETEEEEESTGPRPRDPEQAARMFESAVCYAAALVRRGRWLSALTEARLDWTPRSGEPRHLVIESGVPAPREGSPRALGRNERLRCFDAATYDRLRVLSTELRRVHAEGRELELRLGPYLRLDRAGLGRRLFWI